MTPGGGYRLRPEAAKIALAAGSPPGEFAVWCGSAAADRTGLPVVTRRGAPAATDAPDL